MFFEGAAVNRVKVDLLRGLAISDGSVDPAGGVLFPFGFEENLAFLEKLGVLLMMFLVRGDEVNRVVFVLGVVVGDEALRPCLGFAE
jgi:hypothetical protein